MSRQGNRNSPPGLTSEPPVVFRPSLARELANRFGKAVGVDLAILLEQAWKEQHAWDIAGGGRVPEKVREAGGGVIHTIIFEWPAKERDQFSKSIGWGKNKIGRLLEKLRDERSSVASDRPAGGRLLVQITDNWFSVIEPAVRAASGWYLTAGHHVDTRQEGTESTPKMGRNSPQNGAKLSPKWGETLPKMGRNSPQNGVSFRPLTLPPVPEGDSSPKDSIPPSAAQLKSNLEFDLSGAAQKKIEPAGGGGDGTGGEDRARAIALLAAEGVVDPARTRLAHSRSIAQVRRAIGIARQRDGCGFPFKNRAGWIEDRLDKRPDLVEGPDVSREIAAHARRGMGLAPPVITLAPSPPCPSPLANPVAARLNELEDGAAETREYQRKLAVIDGLPDELWQRAAARLAEQWNEMMPGRPFPADSRNSPVVRAAAVKHFSELFEGAEVRQ